jgi:hypothetical protein
MRLPEPYFGHPEGYLCLSLPAAAFAQLPEHIEISGTVLRKKKEFHVTVMSLKSVIPLVAEAAEHMSLEEVQERILGVFVSILVKHPITFAKWQDDFRIAESDFRMSLLVRCTAINLDYFFAECEKVFGIAIPRQPAHVTLYTLQPDAGIGVDSESQMTRLPNVSFPEILAILPPLTP